MKKAAQKPTKRNACPDLPTNMRSVVKGSFTPVFRLVEENRQTNQEYAREHGITVRQASKKRRGY